MRAGRRCTTWGAAHRLAPVGGSGMHRWLEAAAVYREPRVIAILFLGFSSGLPFGALAEPLIAWLAESGVTKTTIGLFALVSTPYSLKFLWAPLMDRVRLPVLTRALASMVSHRITWWQLRVSMIFPQPSSPLFRKSVRMPTYWISLR